ncbi:MAG TPA: hypothetical protein VF137_11925 [Candidatus Dormibacteraeota bacterium]
MTYTLAVLLLIAVFPFVTWPLIQGRVERVRRRPRDDDRRLELREEVELDLATGRLSPEEARERLAAL